MVNFFQQLDCVIFFHILNLTIEKLLKTREFSSNAHEFSGESHKRILLPEGGEKVENDTSLWPTSSRSSWEYYHHWQNLVLLPASHWSSRTLSLSLHQFSPFVSSWSFIHSFLEMMPPGHETRMNRNLASIIPTTTTTLTTTQIESVQSDPPDSSTNDVVIPSVDWNRMSEQQSTPPLFSILRESLSPVTLKVRQTISVSCSCIS